MAGAYFNYESHLASGYWGRRTFLRHWWRFYLRDPHWVPPYYPAVRHALHGPEPHVTRLSPHWLYLEALPRPRGNLAAGSGSFPAAGGWTRPVAAAALLHDPRERGGIWTLGLLRCANDEETLNQLLEAAATESKAQTFSGPSHLSPYLGTGALASHWHLLPPLHTPYNPPYLPALLGSVMEQAGTATLYQMEIPADTDLQATAGPALLQPLDPTRLASELLPLLIAACSPWRSFPPPDSMEATFLLRWLEQWPLNGLVALVDEEPVGFVLLQPDLAPCLQRAGGGRNLLWRLWLQRAARSPAKRGRLLFGAVLPQWRKQGIGRQLLHATLIHARKQGWETITAGPLPATAPAVYSLTSWKATPRQTYHHYRWQAPPASFFF